MTDNSMPIAAIYVRVSTEEQATLGLSIPAQVETLSQYCQAFGITVYSIYEDLGISGKDTVNRPGLNRLVRDSGKALFNMVLVWKISRLSRSLKDLLYLIDIFEKNKITFASYSEKFDTSTPVGRMTLQLLGSIAEFERNTIVENVRLGLGEHARRGGKTGVVLGYKNIDKQLAVDEKEAETVRLIFDLYTDKGYSFSDIARHLNSKNLRTKHGKLFRGDSIALILGNPVYVGINRHHVKSAKMYEVKGAHSPIISEAVWSAAQARLLQKKGKSSNQSVQNQPQLAIVYCPCCCSSMKAYYSLAKGRRYRYYRCTAHNGKPFYCRADNLEAMVIEHTTALLANEQLLEDLRQAFSIRVNEHSAARNLEITSTVDEREALDSLINKYLSLLEAELLENAVLNKRMQQLAGRISELDARLARLNSLDAEPVSLSDQELIFLVSSFINDLQDSDIAGLYNLVNSFINKIIPGKTDASLELKTHFPVTFK